MHSRPRRLHRDLSLTFPYIILVAVLFGAYLFGSHTIGSISGPPPSTTVAGLAVSPIAQTPAGASGPAGPSATTLPAATSTAATSTAAPPTTSSTRHLSVAPEPFDGSRAMAHVRSLAEDIGARQAGSEAEGAAVDYVAGCLRGFGYRVEITNVPLPDGRISHNLRAVKAGASGATVLLGAHLDTIAPSPGANDNASGVAVLVELARDLSQADVTPTVEFVFFGTEEVINANADHHHYGSRQFVQQMPQAQAAELAGMVSVDMIAYGAELVVRTMGRGPRELADMLLEYAPAAGLAAAYARDPGNTGWSDHEAFEKAGYAAAWLERRPDSAHHTSADTYQHCDPALVQQTGELLLGFLRQLTATDLELLKAARRAG